MHRHDNQFDSEQYRTEVTALIKGVNSVLQCNNLREAVKGIFESCKQLTGAQGGYIALLNREHHSNEPLFLDSGSVPCTIDPALPIPLRGMREMAYKTGEPVVDNDFGNSHSQKFMPAGHFAIDNILFAPLKLDGVPVGLLGLANKPGGFDAHDIRLASAFSNLAAVALQKEMAFAALADREQQLKDLVQHEVIERRRAEKLYRLLFNSGNDAIYVYHLKNGQPENMVEVNEVGLSRLGYKREELIGMPFGGFIADAVIESAEWDEFWQNIISNGQAMLDSTHITKSGQEIPVEVNAHLLQYEGNSWVIAIARDVTERKKAQYNLKRQLDFEKIITTISARLINGDTKQADEYIIASLREISEFLAVDRSFIYRVSDDGKMLVLTHSWSRPGDYVEIPKTVNLCITPFSSWVESLRNGKPIYIAENEALETDKAVLEELGLKAGLLAPMVCGGKFAGVLGYSHTGEERERNARKAALFQMLGEIFASVIRRKQELERLEKSEASSLALLRSVPDTLFRVHRDGRVLDCRIAKAKQKSVIDSIEQLPFECGTDLRDKILTAINTREIQLVESKIELDNGEQLIKEARIVGIDDAEALIIIRDVTDVRLVQRKTAEAELKLAKAQKLASLGVMAAGIAHEINQPLHSIKLAASGVLYLQECGVQPCMEELMDEFRKISDEADRIAQVMSSVKALVQSSGASAPTDVHAAIDSALSLLGPRLQSGGIAVERRFCAKRLKILGSFPQMEQVAANLIKNSIQALEQINCLTKRICITTAASKGQAVIDISDNGGGFRLRDRDKLFEPFFSTKDNSENMGLGLSIVQSIVSNWNGTIDARNNTIGGATFSIKLPLYRGEG